MTSSVDLSKLHIDDFASCTDKVFELHAVEASVPLKLVKVAGVGNSGRPGGAFSLLFAGPTGRALPQAIYPVKHPALGTMEIFLVPIGPVADGSGYQAIFT